MKIDMAALRGLEREKDISFDKVCQAIESALLTAYRHTEGAQPHARVDLDRKSGDVRVLAQELGEDGTVAREWDDTPADFGRIATSTARQVILQRLREAESELSYDAYAGREGDVVSGLVQQAGQRPGRPAQPQRHGQARHDRGRPRGGPAAGRAGARRGVRARRPSQVPRHRRGPRPARRVGDGLPHPPRPGARPVRPGGARGRGRLGRDRRARPRGRPPHQGRGPLDRAGARREGRVHRPGRLPRPRRDRRAARREDRHRRLVARPRAGSSPPPSRRPG